jgi:hypothetical protein
VLFAGNDAPAVVMQERDFQNRIPQWALRIASLRLSMRACAATVLSAVAVLPAAAEGFRSDSKRFGNPEMDIVIAEVERHPRISIMSIGSSPLDPR